MTEDSEEISPSEPSDEQESPLGESERPLSTPPAVLVVSNEDSSDTTAAYNRHVAAERSWEEIRRARRRHVRTCVILFFATLLSTFLVGSGYAPLQYFAVQSSQDVRNDVERAILKEAFRTNTPPVSIDEYFQKQFLGGLEYAIPLMVILLSHEMGHYLVAVRYRVPASLPYFIPLPLPPLGTMGAVILQGRGAANRVQMFDIAVWGPLAGLFVTLPVLWYGIDTSEYRLAAPMMGAMELGEPLILQWMIQALHGPLPEGYVFTLNGYAMAGWVGVFVTALNLLPVGQLDGGHILYTLVGRRAHWIAWGVIIGGCVAMWLSGTMSYILILILLLLTGVRHPPTANDSMRLGLTRQVLGWATLSFLIIGFTPQPIMVSQPRPRPEREQVEPQQEAALNAPGDSFQDQQSPSLASAGHVSHVNTWTNMDFEAFADHNPGCRMLLPMMAVHRNQTGEQNDNMRRRTASNCNADRRL